MAQFLQQLYNVSPAIPCKLLKAGVNHSYPITDGSTKAIFRLYSLNRRTEAEINEELKLLALLTQHGIPVSYSLPNVHDSYMLEAPEASGFCLGIACYILKIHSTEADVNEFQKKYVYIGSFRLYLNFIVSFLLLKKKLEKVFNLSKRFA